MRLRDRVIIVTGGAAGIGEQYCYGLAQEGARVCLVDILPQAELDHVVSEIEAEGGEAFALRVDVSSQEQTTWMARAVYERWGRIDGLVNNAVWQPAKPFDQYTVEEFDRMMAVNVRGVWLCIVAVYPYLKEKGRGKIVNIGSQTFFSGWWNLAPYVGTKGAVIGMTRALAREISPDGIRVNCLCPGLTVTEGSLREVDASIHPGRVNEWLDRHVAEQCIPHPGYPQDLVGPLIFLLSDDSDFMTGQTILVDGGWAMH
ncbi:MAG: SDR family oxidoreductase [Ardenticatenaceae bacterium]|nr:SDR family oxidoreductase [Ardenticatenaceae bacterium]HBY97326.1 dehydrogenase [Chloroflexota bacterium]